MQNIFIYEIINHSISTQPAAPHKQQPLVQASPVDHSHTKYMVFLSPVWRFSSWAFPAAGQKGRQAEESGKGLARGPLVLVPSAIPGQEKLPSTRERPPPLREPSVSPW